MRLIQANNHRAKIRVMVVDDSAFMRKSISAMINSQKDMEVVATARNGEEALKSIATLNPDVITLDVEMQKMDGIVCLGYIMSEWPTPVIMLSAHTHQGSELTIKALEFGAVDFVQKPDGEISLRLSDIQDELLQKIRIASKVNVQRLKLTLAQAALSKRQSGPGPFDKIVAIGASTGGPSALTSVLTHIPVNFPAPILVVQHMPEHFTLALARRLDWESELKVKEAEDNDELHAGTVYIGKGGHRLTVETRSNSHQNYMLSVKKPATAKKLCPSVDDMMISAAKVFGSQVIGIVLTGMGNDGTAGLHAIYEMGGYTIAQDEASSVIFGMPKSCIRAGVVRRVLSLSEIPSFLKNTLMTHSVERKAG